ncbi:DUF5993 family protein [Longimycelium tulufanense]|uniref:DUF5993 family protein n=1 Tax=Longimycelium tulufanense TaxID=907463 RepID=UPI00166B6AEE|nr:DUF5993 family protein [Longimycelium tulufanense]
MRGRPAVVMIGEGVAPSRRWAVDTVIFLLLTAAVALLFWSGRRWVVLTVWAVSLVLALLLFDHHVTSPLDLNF